MSVNEADLWAGLERAGLLRAAQVGAVTCKVGYFQPSELLFGEVAQANNYLIEYRKSDLSNLALGANVIIDGVQYVVIQPPRDNDTGYFAKAELRKL